jgi:predicted nucleotidyltransferase component of viral defense system
MAANQRADLFGETANRMGLSGAVVEKDSGFAGLKQLFSIEAFSGRLLFKGGTSLSKYSAQSTGSPRISIWR